MGIIKVILRGDIGRLEDENRRLTARVDKLEDEVSNLNDDVNGLNKTNDILGQLVAAVNLKVTDLVKTVATDSLNIAKLSAIVENLSEATEILIFQGDDMANSITGIVVGSKGSFSALLVPAGSIVAPGKVIAWASDNPLAVVSAATDGLSAVVTVDPSAPVGGSFNLSASFTRTDGAVASGSAAVPFLPAPPPPPVEATSIDINQTA